jgi:hypothetical protein
MPKRRLNSRVKCAGLSKPTSNATSPTRVPSWASSARVCSSRRARRVGSVGRRPSRSSSNADNLVDPPSPTHTHRLRRLRATLTRPSGRANGGAARSPSCRGPALTCASIPTCTSSLKVCLRTGARWPAAFCATATARIDRRGGAAGDDPKPRCSNSKGRTARSCWCLRLRRRENEVHCGKRAATAPGARRHRSDVFADLSDLGYETNWEARRRSRERDSVIGRLPFHVLVLKRRDRRIEAVRPRSYPARGTQVARRRAGRVRIWCGRPR